MDEAILLTGATGFIGSHLLARLLREGRCVVALVRADDALRARQRLEQALVRAGHGNLAHRDRLHVVPGDFNDPTTLSRPDLRELLRACPSVVHTAACIRFQSQANGDPQETNVGGTRRLYHLLARGRMRHWVQVSTAYVAGQRRGPIREDDTAHGPFRNAYESSKFQAEQFLRAASAQQGFRLSIARPAIVVGEYATGRTSSYQGFYHPLRLFALLLHLAKRRGELADLTLRVDLRAEGIRNLVPVDWVARRIAALLTAGGGSSGAAAGGPGVFHLAPSEPTRNDEILAAVERFWGCRGVRCDAGVRDRATRNRWERMFYANLGALGPYWGDEPRFDSRNLRSISAGDPCPRIDRDAIVRLLTFAEADHWGNRGAAERHGSRFPCDWYLRTFLPQRVAASQLGRIPSLTLKVGLRLSGPSGGAWTCDFRGGELVAVSEGAADDARVTFVGDSATFAAVVAAETSPREAFFQRRFEIEGDVEAGLKLAAVFEEFVRDFPCPAMEAAACA